MQSRAVTLRYVTYAILLAVCSSTAPWVTAGEQPQHPAKSPKETQKSTSKKNSRSVQTNAVQAAPSNAQEGTPAQEVQLLKQRLATQQEQIEQFRLALEEQRHMLEQALRSGQSTTSQDPGLGEVASLRPVIPAAPGGAVATPGVGGPASPGPGAPVTQDQMQGYTKKVDALDKTVGALSKGLAGFKLSGDFRLRSDNIFRSANSVAGAAQNVRARYRLRLNVDKAVSDQIDTHLQLGSGTFNNPLTYDSDFNGTATRGPVFITEVWGDYHPNKHLDFRGGKMPAAFADNSRFLLDDDIRFNGFQETVRQSFGKGSIEFRASQYVFTNPNVQVLPSTATCAGNDPPANCAYITAGFTPGRKVPSTNMFDQGVVVTASPSENWTHQVTLNFELWRNPNSIQLASLASGFPLLGNSYYGVVLSGPISGLGNGTTTKGGAIFTAESFHIGQVAYVLTYKGWKSHRQGFPVSLEFHGAKNFGADFYGNALLGQISAGETKKAADVAFKYGFFYKQANSMISQITDDDAGTGTGVNLKTHMLRFDVGLNKFMVWQNILFIQNELAGNDPARNFFVNLPAGTARQYRYQGQLQFSF